MTTGSVDDGKSTLIGRLLYETNCVPIDQYEAARLYSQRRGRQDVDLSFLLDGLQSEREQGITIDVAYRYFETAIRKFIVADCPGHEQYTRNMITGASNANVGLILIDAKNGVLTQSKRHGFLLSLLGISQLIVVVNKMDLVDYSQKRFEDIVENYNTFCSNINIPSIIYIPASALKGDNITTFSPNMPWYRGEPVLQTLENVNISHRSVDFRFPVQLALRSNSKFRGYAGTIASGSINKDDQVMILPSMRQTSVKSIIVGGKSTTSASETEAVVLALNDEIDIDRGDMVVRPHNLPNVSNNFDAMVCWMDNNKLEINKRYILKHTSKKTAAFINEIYYKVDVNTTHRQETKELELNEIGKISVHTSDNLFADLYSVNKCTGSFILIDPMTNSTAAVGMIRSFNKTNSVSKHVKGKTIWLTGLPCSGKTTIAEAVVEKMLLHGQHVISLDGDDVRNTLNSDLGFDEKDRYENLRRIACMCEILNSKGITTICSFVSPTERLRKALDNISDLQLVYVKASPEICAKRDVKGMWKKAKNGEIANFTGYNSPFEPPATPALTLETEILSLEECVKQVIALI